MSTASTSASSVSLPSSSNPSVSAQFTYSNGSYFPVPFHLQQPYVAAPPPPPVMQVHTPVVKVPSVYQAAAPLPGVYSLPQYQQAQQLFQRDAQTITPEALESVKAALASSEIEHKAETKKKAIPRKAAGQNWEDPTLTEWPENDYRLFCGDLGNEVNDDVLSKAFSRFPSFNMARVVRDKRTGKTKGYGFVSFANPLDLAAALKEMNGKYVGNRPIKLRKSNWRERTDHEALERQKNHSQRKPKLSKKSVLHK
ncbi:RNA-binding protein 42 [Camellia lanceoleosa]|uniref:RNA-binding protein 42 n=1 Tax=Camellia lanceoleosa TaxID=1840588 RepID=A0ACC0H600_9ERIC|nr:RNA-binding protein 42 [Camellia lanceoleosa]